VRVSVGIAACTGRPDDALAAADAAMYRAKRDRRGLVLGEGLVPAV
jgi:GGDEF domain-containing protein